jgi:hypothetical protein
VFFVVVVVGFLMTQSGNFWINPRISCSSMQNGTAEEDTDSSRRRRRRHNHHHHHHHDNFDES